MSAVTPALSASEWEQIVISQGSATAPINFGHPCQDGIHWLHTDPEALQERHKLAALCLHGQTFGFSQEDVSLILKAATLKAWGTYPYPVPEAEAYKALAARISALLPPEGP